MSQYHPSVSLKELMPEKQCSNEETCKKCFQRFSSIVPWIATFILIAFVYHYAVRNIKLVDFLNQKTASNICQPFTNVMFLKTHKTASSTVFNILFRFSEKHNLIVALPCGNAFHLGYPRRFQASFVEEYKSLGQKFNLMGNHMRFNWQQVRKIMPSETFYFSILREPASLLESSYVYYKRSAPAFRNSKNINEFLSSPWLFYNLSEKYWNIYAKNNMWFDFGYNNNAEYNEHYVQSVLKKIEQIFHLILIAEFFDESMIILKDILCWDLDDVVYFKLNTRNQQSRQALNPENKEKVKEWCALDWKLYEHFNNSFWLKVQERMDLQTLYKEVDLLQKRQKELTETCLLEEPSMKINDDNLKPYQSGEAKILGYNLREDIDIETLSICKKMAMPELQHTAHLYNTQFPFKKKDRRIKTNC